MPGTKIAMTTNTKTLELSEERAEISRVLAWERVGFVARLEVILTHRCEFSSSRRCGSYLRTRGDAEGCKLLLECLRKVRSSSALIRARLKHYPSHVLDVS